MATANVISIIGTAVSVLSFFLDQVPQNNDKARFSYVIANDGANGDLSNAGGNLPDLRAWDETIEYLGGDFEGEYCAEGQTACTDDVETGEAVTYTLFTGNSDAICIAWTAVSWAGGQKKYGFHPGNWAYACDAAGYNGDMQHGVW